MLMKIRDTVWYKNRTKRYVLPIVKTYGKEFLQKISSIMKIAVGIGDTILQEEFSNHIFFLINIDIKRDEFIKAYDWFKENGYLVKDYAYDDIHTGHLQMLVFKIPDSKPEFINKFLEGKFSQMYNPDEIEKFFVNSSDKSIFKILTKDKSYRKVFLSLINKTFNLDLKFEDYFKSNPNSELDLKPIPREEYFNHK